MKPLLARYFFRRIAGAILLIWTALMALLVLFEVLRGADDGGLAQTMLLALLRAPQFAMEILPFACAIGGALAMRRMVADNEMPALRAAGLSPAAIVALHLLAAAPFAAAYLLLSEVASPAGATLARQLEDKSAAGRDIWLTEDGVFIRIARLDSADGMQDIAIFYTQDGDLTGIQHARRASYSANADASEGGASEGDGAKTWLLRDLSGFHKRDGRLQQSQRQTLEMPLQISPDSFTAFTARPRELSLTDAMRINRDLRRAGQIRHDLEKTIWRRWLALPALFLLAALGVSCIGLSRRGRYAVALPVLLVTLTAGLYFIARDIAIQLATISGAPLALLAPPLALVAWLAWQTRRASML